jgi:hypothetical protein
MMFETITDHATAAKARQVEFFKDKPNFDALIGVFAERYQGLEDVLRDFRDKLHIDGAEGVQIDKLGLIFQELRGNLGDVPYRAAVKTSFARKARAGEIETLIEAYGAYTRATKITLTEYFPCTVILNAEVDDPVALEDAHINAGMNRIRAAGIEIDTTVSVNVRPFSFISLSDLPDDDLGWSDGSGKGGTFGSKI